MNVEDWSLSDAWDKKCTTQIALFDPLVQRFRLAFDKKYSKEHETNISPLEKAIEEYVESEEELPNGETNTKVIDEEVRTRLLNDLNDTCRRALSDYVDSFNMQYSDDVVISNHLETRKQEFFENE